MKRAAEAVLYPRWEVGPAPDTGALIAASRVPLSESNERVTLHEGNALSHEWEPGTRWDYAWHDLHVVGSGLETLHARVLSRYMGMARKQGAWRFPKWVRRRDRRCILL